MLTLSTTLTAAIAAGNPQRVLLEFLDDEGDVQTNGTFSNEEIVVNRGIHLTMPFNAEKELTLGMCPSVQITFALLNDVRQLTEFTFGECRAWIGARIDTGTPASGAKTKTFTEGGTSRLYEFAPLGIFKVDRPDVVQKDIIEISANDRMTRFDVEMPSKEELSLDPSASSPVTILALLDAMCDFVGLELANTSPNYFLNYDLSFTSWPSNYFNGKTMRDVLSWIAEAAGSFARITRSGQLEIAWFNTTTVVYDESDYKDFSMTWYQTAAIDGLKVRNSEETSESSYGTDPENVYVISGNPFLK